jgi:gamma-glutamyltranspeptidase/glutathione hydrolase
VLLNNEMDDFVAKPGVPNLYGLVGSAANAIAPGKRPLSSMTPTLVEADDAVLILGTPGGSRIISMVLLATLDFAAGERDVARLVARPRFHHQYQPDQVEYEPGALSPELLTALRESGYRLVERMGGYGNMQAILWDKRQGRLTAASDPRGQGAAQVR